MKKKLILWIVVPLAIILVVNIGLLMKSDHGKYIIEIVDSHNTPWPDNVVFGTHEEPEPYLEPY